MSDTKPFQDGGFLAAITIVVLALAALGTLLWYAFS